MSKRSDDLLLNDILESITKIKLYTSNLNFDSFINDSKTVDAVIRNFEIIGEASNRLSEVFKENNAEIDWFRIIGFRNRIVHDYMGIDFEIVWSIIQNDLDSLLLNIEKIKSKN
jgi:uncharacterized protein with HEPN domain